MKIKTLEPETLYLKKNLKLWSNAVDTGEMNLRKKLGISESKRIGVIDFFTGKFDDEELKEKKKWLKERRRYRVDWNKKHYKSQVDTFYKENILKNMKLKLPIPEVITKKEESKYWVK